MSEVKHRQERPPRWILTLLIVAVLGFTIWGTVNTFMAQQNAATRGNNANTLATEILEMCKSGGKLVYNDRDLCSKAADVQDKPDTPLAGPMGPKGDKGDKGDTGATGATGAKGATGSTGSAGINGVNGTNGTPGEPGTQGAAGAQGEPGVAGPTGPAGPAGAQGPQGDPGATGPKGDKGDAPSQFTWTDPVSGRTMTCVPNPPGSTSYTCEPGPAPVPAPSSTP